MRMVSLDSQRVMHQQEEGPALAAVHNKSNAHMKPLMILLSHGNPCSFCYHLVMFSEQLQQQ